MRWRYPFLGLLILACLGAVSAGVRPAHREAWLEDYHQLRDHMAVAYANLDWMIEAGKVDVVALDEATEGAIRRARTDREARKAIAGFLAAFHDGHVNIQGEPPHVVQRAMAKWAAWRGRPEGVRPARSWSGEQACDALGYSDGDASWSLPFDDEVGYRELGAIGPMRGAVLTRGADTLGLVRFSLFSPHDARAACVRAWGSVRETLYLGPCGDECEQLLYDEVGDAMLATLRDWLVKMRSAGARTVLVDLAGNGGGSEWVDAAARMFAKGPLRAPRSTAVRHAHTAKWLAVHAAELDSASQWPGLHPELRDLLEQSRDRYAELAELAREECDRREIWRDPSVAGQCPGTLPPMMYTTGIVGWLPDSAFGGAPEAALLYGPAGKHTRGGAWTGKVVILVDRGTASAAEQFAATLRDNDRARLVGQHTLGAGCGYVNGGIPLTLRNSGLKIRMPNCARLRRNGDNEVFGLEPDQVVPLELGPVLAAAKNP